MDYLSQLPQEILQLTAINLSAHQLYNNRTINRVCYALYNDQNFWKLKFQYDHGFLPETDNKNYRELYYKRIYLTFPTGLVDLKNFARQAISKEGEDSQYNYIYFIDYEYNLWWGTIKNDTVSMIKVIKDDI